MDRWTDEKKMDFLDEEKMDFDDEAFDDEAFDAESVKDIGGKGIRLRRLLNSDNWTRDPDVSRSLPDRLTI